MCRVEVFEGIVADSGVEAGLEGAVLFLQQLVISLYCFGVIFVQAIGLGIDAVHKDVGGVYGTVFLRYVYGVFILVACYIDVAEFGSRQVIIGISFLNVQVGIYHIKDI